MEVTKALLEKYYRGQCNAAEKQQVEAWLMKPEGFTGGQMVANAASASMWKVIYAKTIGIRRWYVTATVAAGIAILLYIWPHCGLVNAWPHATPKSYVVIDNTSYHYFPKRKIGELSVSESANSGWKHIDKGRQMYTNSLIINNQKGEDIWVYLKTSSESGSGMIKFLCERNKTYVAGFITEYTDKGNRKYLYSKQTCIPARLAGSINSQLNAAGSYATIII